MNKPEFNRWWHLYRNAFPEAAESLAKSENGGKTTLELWHQAFGDVEFSDAETVVKLMVSGDLPAIRVFERGETAAIVRRHARELAYKRTAKPEEAPWRVHAERSERLGRVGHGNAVQRDPGMRAALDEYLRMQAAGASQAELKAMLRQRFPENPGDRREQFSCRLCRDSGYVPVWSQRSIRACLDGELEERQNRSTATIPCSCHRGTVKLGVKSKDTGRDLWKRCFDMNLDCLCRDPDDEDAIAELKIWCDEKRCAKPANYERGFDEWNERT